MLLTSLRDVIRTQAEEIEDLQRKVEQLTPYADNVSSFKIYWSLIYMGFRWWA